MQIKNKYDDMTFDQLKARLNELKAEITATDYEGQTIPRKDARKTGEILTIQRILDERQSKEQAE